jgi:arylsulfatase A-like enzyme
VIGSTDRTGGKVTSRPVSYEDVFATLYKTLGIDATKTTIPDPTGRPQFLLDRGEVISELF